MMEIGRLVGREQRPVGLRLDALEEEIGYPTCRECRDRRQPRPGGGVEVVGAAALVAGVAAQIEEILEIEMPHLEVGAGGAAPFAAAVDRQRHVVCHLEERQELDDPRLAVARGLVEREPHRHPHPEALRCLDPALVETRQVAVGERLQPQVVEELVALKMEGGRQAVEVEAGHARVEQLAGDGRGDGVAQAAAHGGVALGAADGKAEDLLVDALQQQAGSDLAVVGVALDEAGGGEGHGALDERQAGGGAFERCLDAAHVEQHAAAVALGRRQAPAAGALRGLGADAFAQPLALRPVEDVRLGGGVAAGEHEVLLDHVLDVLDVRIEVDEAAVELFVDAVDEGVELRGGQRVGARRGGGEDGVADAREVEGHDVAGALDDATVVRAWRVAAMNAA
jgi:hypothetical protein